jgi:hypothetical protein
MLKSIARVPNWIHLCLALVLCLGWFGEAAAQEPQPDDAPLRIYLPVITQRQTIPNDPTAVAYDGRITYRGTPIPGQTVNMLLNTGAGWTVYASAVTDANGIFTFAGLPPLTWDTRYYVTWRNTGLNPNWLAAWVCDPVDIYTFRTASFRCSFDIEDIDLLTPGPADTYGLPLEFTWSTRLKQGEDYELNIGDVTDYNPVWSSDPYREPVDYYKMYTQPANLESNTWYAWFMHIHGENGYGRSLVSHPLIFTGRGTNVMVGPAQQTIKP